MESPESCIKREAAARIAVAHPEQLARDPWATHLRECPECRDICRDLARSLAVFRQVEEDRLAGRSEFGPSWEQFASALRGEPHHRRFMRRYRLPVAAAAVGGMILFAGTGIWYSDTGNGVESPARIVRVDPGQRQVMQQVVQQSLAGGGGATGPSVAASRPAPRLSPVEPIATEEVAAEPSGLYASGERSMQSQPVLRPNHPFLDRGDVASAVDENPSGGTSAPTFPVIARPRMTEQVTFPVYAPSGR